MAENNVSKNAFSGEIIGLISETHIHVGTGQSVDALDLPVARERVTQYPFVPGSGVKGAFSVWAKERTTINGKQGFLFGKGIDNDANGSSQDDGSDQSAGALLCSDARLLLLPVRSMASAYKWVTCPGILNRLSRDIKRAGATIECNVQEGPGAGNYFGEGSKNNILGLEERNFKCAGEVNEQTLNALSQVIPHQDMQRNLKDTVVVIRDDDFTWFAKYALPIMSRNRLDQDKIVVPGALWHEETLPPDTVLYLTLGERRSKAISIVKEAVKSSPYIQMGGNETIGQGWFAMACLGETI